MNTKIEQQNITLYGLASAIAVDLNNTPRSLNDLRTKYTVEKTVLFEKAVDLLAVLSQIKVSKFDHEKLYFNRRKVDVKDVCIAALS